MDSLQKDPGVSYPRFTGIYTLTVHSVAICFLLSTLVTRAAFTNFLTRSGDQLRDGASLYHFVGVNTPGVMFTKDKGYFSQYDDLEYEDIAAFFNQ